MLEVGTEVYIDHIDKRDNRPSSRYFKDISREYANIKEYVGVVFIMSKVR